MKNLSFKKSLLTAFTLVILGYVSVTLGYPNATVLMDATGTNANATDLGQVNCDASSDRLYAMIQDQSAPVSGLLLSLHIFSGIRMTTSTDSISGDANPSPIIYLNGGQGPYYISATKTAAGARLFTVTFQCASSNNTLTGTSVIGIQGQ
ncbi:MAG: hypothetical protein D0531_05070 [Methylococcales bacterium]|nr:MAG: hypothetical protein D0531_05070 [Methylococcales bacterium]